MTSREARKLWAEALESGEFKQGQGCLQPADDEFCCLGVLCVLAERDGVRSQWTAVDTHPPPAVVAWVGLDDPSGGFAAADCLVDMNDSGASFSEIAAVIRAEPEGLFVEDPAS